MMDYCGKLNNGYGTTHMFHWEAGDSMYQEYPGFVVFIGATIIGFWYWCTDQHIVQRVLGQVPGESNVEVMKRARRGTIAAANRSNICVISAVCVRFNTSDRAGQKSV